MDENGFYSDIISSSAVCTIMCDSIQFDMNGSLPITVRSLSAQDQDIQLDGDNRLHRVRTEDRGKISLRSQLLKLG